jgi:ribonuclease HI
MSAPVHGTTTINPMSLLNKPQRAKSPTSTTSSAGSKRKRGTEPKFYAVRAGHKPGVYSTWADCLAQVKGFKNATC